MSILWCSAPSTCPKPLSPATKRCGHKARRARRSVPRRPAFLRCGFAVFFLRNAVAATGPAGSAALVSRDARRQTDESPTRCVPLAAGCALKAVAATLAALLVSYRTLAHSQRRRGDLERLRNGLCVRPFYRPHRPRRLEETTYTQYSLPTTTAPRRPGAAPTPRSPAWRTRSTWTGF